MSFTSRYVPPITPPWLGALSFVAWLVGCGPGAQPSEPLSGRDLAGTETGNPPAADQETCDDQRLCALSARLFSEALAGPLTLQLRGACVEDLGDSYCACQPETDANVEAPSAFVWPAAATTRDATTARGDDCLAWSRLATVLPELRTDPTQCLFYLPGSFDASSCDLAACRSLCAQVQAARSRDDARQYDVTLRSARCKSSDGPCEAVFELEEQCYAKSGARVAESKGPFDCSQSDEAILDQAYPGWK